MRCWPGDTISLLRRYGYITDIEPVVPTPATADSIPGSLLSQRAAIIESVSESDKEVLIRMVDDDSEYRVTYGHYGGDDIEHFGFYRDLRYAQDHYLGRTFYIAREKYLVNDTGTCRFPLHTPVTVVDVRFHIYSFAPIKLVLHDSTGQTCYCTTYVSGTNMFPQMKSVPWHSLAYSLLDSLPGRMEEDRREEGD